MSLTQKLKTMELTFDTETMLEETSESSKKVKEANEEEIRKMEESLKEKLSLLKSIREH